MIAQTIQPVEIRHLNVPLTSIGDSISFGDPIPNPDMLNPIEQRYCLASAIPNIRDIVSVRIDPDSSASPYNDPAGASRLMTTMHDLGRELFGGSGIGRGVFYGANWDSHSFRNTSEAIGYLSLAFTPFRLINGKPDCYHARILIEPDEAFESIGLPAGYGTVVSGNDHGQVRFLVGGATIGKGVAVGRSTLTQIGISIPEHWQGYDLVACESDLKINPLPSGEYSGFYGITNVNPETIHGQPVSLGFEFWQFLNLDRGVLAILREQLLQGRLPDYTSMISSNENQRRLAAYSNNHPYCPLEIHSTLEEALHVLGPQFPWVADHLEPVVSNYLLSQRFPGTEYRMTIVVKDFIDYGFYHDPENASIIGGKYPVTAGLAQLAGHGIAGPFTVLKQSTADMLNIDADGDAMFLCRPDRNPIFKTVLDKHLIKPIRNLDIQTREKYDLPLTLDNIARTAWRIYISSSQIGNLTVSYYLSEIANDSLGTNIDLSLFYKGIERVIKSAKHRMDLSFLKEMDFETMQGLREMLAMPFLRSEKKAFSTAVNAGDFKDLQTLAERKIPEPLHYTEHIWNWTLDRMAVEINRLRANTLPARDLADKIGLNLIPREFEGQLNAEIKQIQGLINVWVAVGKGTIEAAEGLQAIRAASSTFTTVALREALRGYLGRTNGNGGFLVHVAHGRLGEVFGSELQYRVKHSPERLIRLWTNDKVTADFDTARGLQIDSGIPYSGDTVFLPGEESSINLDTAVLITAIPYFDKTGMFTRSLLAVVR